MIQRDFAKSLRSHMTDAESLLWRHLRAHRLQGQKFKRQQPIGQYVVDFVHFGARLIVEADGGQHNASVRDATRDAWLMSQGFKVMRFWNNDILQNTEAVLATILNAVAVAPSPPAPLPRGERGVKGPQFPAPTGKTNPPLSAEERGTTETQTPAPSSVSQKYSPLPSRERGRGEGEIPSKTNSTGTP